MVSSFENPVILTTRCRGYDLLDDGIALPSSPRRVYASTPRSSTILWLAEPSEPRWVHICTLEGFTESSPKLSDHDRILRRAQLLPRRRRWHGDTCQGAWYLPRCRDRLWTSEDSVVAGLLFADIGSLPSTLNPPAEGYTDRR